MNEFFRFAWPVFPDLREKCYNTPRQSCLSLSRKGKAKVGFKKTPKDKNGWCYLCEGFFPSCFFPAAKNKKGQKNFPKNWRSVHTRIQVNQFGTKSVWCICIPYTQHTIIFINPKFLNTQRLLKTSKNHHQITTQN